MSRYDWALKALDNVESELEKKDLLIKSSKEENLTIALLGATQVGKTTLALRLLGARDDELEDLSKIMRGYRKQGESVTAIATVYSPSINRLYSFKICHNLDILYEWKGKKEDFITEIDNIRYNYSDSKSVDILLKIDIPIQKPNILISKVVDLIGLGAENEWEQIISVKMADKWLKYCDLPIFVFRATNLSFLDNKEKHIEKVINSWKFFPLKNKIIISTWSYELKSIKEIINNSKLSNISEIAKQVKEHLLVELERSLSDERLNINNCDIFPLNLINVKGKYYELNIQVEKELFEYIHNIEKNGPELFRLKKAFSYKEKVKKEINKKLFEIDNNYKNLKNDIKDKKKNQKKLEYFIDELNMRKTEIERDFTSLTQLSITNIPFKKSELICKLKSYVSKKLKFKNSIFDDLYKDFFSKLSDKSKETADNKIFSLDSLKKNGIKIRYSPEKISSIFTKTKFEKNFESIYHYSFTYRKKLRLEIIKEFEEWIDKTLQDLLVVIIMELKEQNEQQIQYELIKIGKNICKRNQFIKKLRQEIIEKETIISEYKVKRVKILENLKYAEKITDSYDKELLNAYKFKRSTLLRRIAYNNEKEKFYQVAIDINEFLGTIFEAQYLSQGILNDR